MYFQYKYVVFHIFTLDIMRKFEALAFQEKMIQKLHNKLNSINLHLNLMNM